MSQPSPTDSPQQQQSTRSFFRERQRITVRSVEIARKLAASEVLPGLQEMRLRLEALMMLKREDRIRAKILDEEYKTCLEIYSVITAFENRIETSNGSGKVFVIPFSQRSPEEERNAFKIWLDGSNIPPRWIMKNKFKLTEETASFLVTRFVAKVMPFVIDITMRVADSLQLDDFSEAAGKVSF